MTKGKGSEYGDAIDESDNVSTASSSSRKKYRKGQYQPTGKTLKPRLNERDSVTRGEGRVRVTMEPAFKSIINVYQLIQKEKLKKGATPVYTTLGRAKSAVVGGISSGSSGSGRSQPSPQKLRKSLAPGWEAYFVDSANDLALTEEQKKKVKDYAKLNQQHKKEEKPIRDEIKMAQYMKEQEEKAAIEKSNLAAIKTSQESRTAYKGDSPKNLLIRRMKELKIPLTTEAKIDNDARYSGRDFTDEGIIEINRAFDAAIAEGRMNESPPPFIALTTRTNSPAQTHTVYIKNDLSYRRRKTTHIKVKRPMHGNKRKIPLAKGSKKRVVMKKKGGRR